jgi:transposase
MTHNPRLRAFAQRLREAGKPNKKIIIAVMRKLLVIAMGVLKSGRPYDGALANS